MMTNLKLLPATFDHFPDILTLNAASVHFLSALTQEQLAHLHEHAAYHKVVMHGSEVSAFLLAFGPNAPYTSPNYQWFNERYKRFLYVDRVVVHAKARAQGLGQILYQDIFRTAAEKGVNQVVCEIDLDPPNPISQAFHQKWGFVEVGSQWLAHAGKKVSLQSAPVTATPS